MPALTDIFNQDAFSTIQLTDAINILPSVPGRIGNMGLFTTVPVTRTTIAIEEKHGKLQLIAAQKRGGEPAINAARKRKVRTFNCIHLPLDDSILADDVMNIRAFGTSDAAASVTSLVNDKLAEMKQDHEITREHLRIGAIKGSILDADGSTEISNLFTEYGISQETVNFLLSTDTTDVRALCLKAKRLVEDGLGAAFYDHIHAFVGPDFFDAFISHPDVKASYAQYREGEMLRNDPRSGFKFGGITWEEYRGSVGSVKFVDDNVAHFFPVGTPRLFNAYYAPADFVEAVGSPGKEFYAKQEVMRMGKGVLLHTQSNPFPLCTRPAALVKGNLHTGS